MSEKTLKSKNELVLIAHDKVASVNFNHTINPIKTEEIVSSRVSITKTAHTNPIPTRQLGGFPIS